jgi:NDP-sugar pyrophosphorylase family protein
MDHIEGGWVNSGIYLINPKIIDDFVEQNSDFAKDIIPQALYNKQKLYGYKIKNDLWAIDTPDLFSSTVDKLNIN